MNSTHYAKFNPQNGDRIVTIDSVTSFHPMYRPRAGLIRRHSGDFREVFWVWDDADYNAGYPWSETVVIIAVSLLTWCTVLLCSRHGTGSLGHRVNGSFRSSFTSGSPGHHFDPMWDPSFFRFSKKTPKMQNVHLKCGYKYSYLLTFLVEYWVLDKILDRVLEQ